MTQSQLLRLLALHTTPRGWPGHLRFGSSELHGPQAEAEVKHSLKGKVATSRQLESMPNISQNQSQVAE